MNCLALKSTSKLLDNKIRTFIINYRTWLYYGWVLFIALLTLIPGRSIPDIIDWNFFSLDKIIHFFIFFTLTFLGAIYFQNLTKKHLPAIAISFLIALFYGSLIEYLQTFIPDRGFDYADLTANSMGAFFGGLWYYYRKDTLVIK